MVPDLYTILYFMLIFSEKTFSIAHNTLKDAIQDLRGNLLLAVQSFDELFQTFLNVSHMF